MTRVRPQTWFVLAALALVVVTRLLWLGAESLWVDEVVSVFQSSGDLGALFRDVAADNYPPLHNLVLWITMKLFGESEVVVRMPSLIASVAAAWLAGRIARRLYGERAEATAIALVGIALLHIQYGQEARMYALLAATAAWSQLALLRWLERPGLGRAAAYAIATMLCLYTHYYALFIVLGQNLFIAIERFRPTAEPERRPNLSHWIALQMVTGLTFVPWLSVMLDRVGVISASFWIKEPRPEWDAAFDYFAEAWPVALLLIVAAVLPRWARLPRRLQAEPATPHATSLLLTWWLTTLVVPFVLSFVLQPFFIVRYTLAATTAAFILVAGGVRRLALRPALEVALVVALVAAQIPAVVDYYQRERRPPWRDVAAAIEPEVRSEDRLLAWPNYERFPLIYYLHRNAQVAHLPGVDQLRGRAGEAWVAKVSRTRGRVWLVAQGDDDPAGLVLIRDVLARQRTLETTDRVGTSVVIERWSTPRAR